MLSEILIGLILLIVFLYYKTQRRPHNFPPGPTGIPILGYLPFLGKPIAASLANLSKKYGKIFSVFYGNYLIVFLQDTKLMRDAFKDDRFAGRPQLDVLRERSFGAHRGIIFGTGTPWLEQRRFVRRYLRDFGFGTGSMESLIMDEVVDLVAELKKELNQPVCLDMRFNSAVLNSLWHIIAGERFQHDDPKLQKIIKVLSEHMAKSDPGGPLYFFFWIAKIFPEASGYNRFVRTYGQTYKFLGEYINTHRQTVDFNNPRDLIDVYLNEIDCTTDVDSSFYKDEGEKNLLVTLLDLFVAGSDTTSTLLGWTILYLITYPQVQKKLHDEIDVVIGSSRLPTLSDRPKLPYLEAIITETFRMSSFSALIGLRSTTETLDFQGYTLPKDTIVLANAWKIYHDKDYWGDPEVFRPERFLTPDGKFKPDENMLPFSTGKRACPGESLARDEIFLFLTGILQQIHFEVDKSGPMPSLVPREAFVSRTHPYKVVMNERNSK